MQPALANDPDVHATRLLDAAGLSGVAPAWQALANAAAEANVFHAPGFATAATRALDLTRALHALAVAEPGKPDGLSGLFLFRSRRRWGMPVAVGEALIHPYAPVGTPLLAARDPAAGADGFARWLEHDAAAPSAFLFPMLPMDGPVFAALDAAFAARGFARFPLGLHGRAVLEPATAGVDCLERTVSSGRRKELRRQRRRLAEYGPVTHTVRADEAGLDAFLALEALGWKGRAGTAAAANPVVAGMFRAVMAALAPAEQWRVDLLCAGERPVAAAISLGGARRWLWKIAYDEAFAALSPGVQLVLDITAAAAAEEGCAHYDSCARPGHPMIERIWGQRRGYGDLLVVPRRNVALAPAFASLERLRRSAETGLRRVRATAGG